METINLLLTLATIVFFLAAGRELRKDIRTLNEDLRDCATHVRTNKLLFSTLENKLNKPKKKPGRPKKSTKPKVAHQLNGKQ
tara:strand:+ start:116 stop:361 length:246 start_codon:yes stop_codon:yes gene_type:complete